MTQYVETEQRLTDIIEAARLLGVTQAKKGFGCYTEQDARFEHAMHESIAKHRAAILSADRGEPVAWQERQQLSNGGAWTNWYECSHRPLDAPRRSLLGGEGGIPIEWRPLYAAAPSTPQPDTVQVPREPTQAMINAGCPVGEVVDHYDMATAYRAMIAAAPKDTTL